MITSFLYILFLFVLFFVGFAVILTYNTNNKVLDLLLRHSFKNYDQNIRQYIIDPQPQEENDMPLHNRSGTINKMSQVKLAWCEKTQSFKRIIDKE